MKFTKVSGPIFDGEPPEVGEKYTPTTFDVRKMPKPSAVFMESIQQIEGMDSVSGILIRHIAIDAWKGSRRKRRG
ncbi:MAG: hypothetical protein IBX36_01795 [Dehalococcoidia bacterium]|nr:hypothetical protein [Dehalococcoidia bacterium]